MEVLALLVGAGAVAVSPMVSILRPVAKTAVKGGLAVADATKAAAVLANEQWDDLMAKRHAMAESPESPAEAVDDDGDDVVDIIVVADSESADAEAPSESRLSVPSLKPAARVAIKGGMSLTDAALGAASAAGKQWSDLVASARAEQKAVEEQPQVEKPQVAEVAQTAVEPTVETPLASKSAEPAPAAAAEPKPVVPDDLTRIKGVGPKVAQLLQDAGVTTFAQIAAMDEAQLNTILTNGGDRYRVIDPATWPAQAQEMLGSA